MTTMKKPRIQRMRGFCAALCSLLFLERGVDGLAEGGQDVLGLLRMRAVWGELQILLIRIGGSRGCDDLAALIHRGLLDQALSADEVGVGLCRVSGDGFVRCCQGGVHIAMVEERSRLVAIVHLSLCRLCLRSRFIGCDRVRYLALAHLR